jgi:hypothetical protein
LKPLDQKKKKVKPFRRENYNVQILEELKDYLLKNPSVRFCQALYNLKIVDKQDRFYEESSKTLARVRFVMEDEDGEDSL